MTPALGLLMLGAICLIAGWKNQNVIDVMLGRETENPKGRAPAPGVTDDTRFSGLPTVPSPVPPMGPRGTGKLAWPTTSHTVTSGYLPPGQGFHAGHAGHDGIDIGVAYQPVYAAEDGRVVTALYNNGYGLYISINHGDGLLTFYGHLSKIRVIPGQRVRRGQVIGTSGSTGHSTGPHLHFGVHVNGSGRDPRNYL